MNDRCKPFEERFNIELSIFNRANPSGLEESVANMFTKTIEKLEYKQDFRLLRNAYFRTTSNNRFELDILLLYKESPLAIIEVKRDLNYFTDRLASEFSRYCRILNTKFCYVCNEANFELYENKDCLCKIAEGTLNVENLLKTITPKLIRLDKDVKGPDDEMLSHRLCEIVKASTLGKNTKKELSVILSKANFCSFDNVNFFIDQSLERQFFITLLGKMPDKVCRYTSLPSIFRTLNNHEQSMCSIVCMNDRSETKYASEKIGYETLDSQRDANSCYILSCADISKKDDLTMWRLYGDDGKGVNLEYEIDRSVIEKYSSFAMAPISYADEHGVDYRLELIRNILDTRIDGAKIQLSEWGIWQHFFKPYEYHDESEIRLLFWRECDINEKEQYEEVQDMHPAFKRKWILESTYGVVAPIVCFNIKTGTSNFPLKLEAITIGPKNNEKEQNCFQLKELSIAKGLCKPDAHNFTLVSSIQHYR